MKKLILLLMCICLVACKADGFDEVASSAEITSASSVVTTTAETTAVPETTTVTAETTAETTTVPETTTVTTTTTAETTTVSETTTIPETTTETTTATEETTTVPETTTVTTTAETTTVPETTTVTTAITAETTVTEAETTAVPVDGHEIIEIEGKRYKLTFEDEFDGDALDETKWERCPEWPRQDLNNHWDNDMSYLDGNGNLIIEMSYDETEDKYLSGAVRTKGKFEQAYGYFEIKCTVNTVPGYWTAFWLMGECVGDVSNGGRNGTEIDIMESAYYDTKEIQNTLNWDGYGSFHKYDGKKTVVDAYDGEYHTFSVLWTKKEYIFYIDGVESWRTEAEKAMGTCEEPLYVKVTSEMGSWTKGALLPENLPDYMKVDYVRVYSAE